MSLSNIMGCKTKVNYPITQGARFSRNSVIIWTELHNPKQRGVREYSEEDNGYFVSLKGMEIFN